MEIISQILETVNYNGDGMGVTPTTLIYEVILSSAQMKEYLTALTIHGLLNYNPAIRRYGITKKGLHYLELHNKLG